MILGLSGVAVVEILELVEVAVADVPGVVEVLGVAEVVGGFLLLFDLRYFGLKE